MQSVNLLVASLLVFASSTTAIPQQKSGKIIGVTGDDVVIIREGNDTVKVRLQGVDAPERGQPFSKAANKRLQNLVRGKVCIFVETKKDAHGMQLAKVFVDNHSINKKIIAEGLAWHFKQHGQNKALAEAEKVARRKRLGLWKDEKPTAPWEWRKLNKGARTLAITGRQGPVVIPVKPSSQLTHWLNAKSGVRHNSSCRWYGKTKRGRKCKSDEGKACGQCGG